MKKRKQKTKSYTMTCPPLMRAEISRQASETGRSLSGYLTWLIRNDCRKRGLIKE
jgi:hypothetical protein